MSNNPLTVSVEGPQVKKRRILPRKFTVNGAISDVQEYFFVEPDNSKLLDDIDSKAYIMLTGHRGSGKTTRCWFAIHHQLAKYEVLMTTFQSITSANSETFWVRYGRHIKRQCTFWAPDQTDITDVDSFLEFFKYHAGKKIVLFVDEFDLLLLRPDILKEFLNVLWSIKDERPSKYGLQSLVAIGPYNVSRYTKGELSPFNAMNHWDIPYWTKVQVKELFREFEDYYGVVLEVGVVDSIFAITLGHPGMVCFCGEMIQEKLLESCSLSLQAWEEYEVLDLRRDIREGWRTVAALADSVKDPRYHEFLIRYLLSSSDSVAYNEEDIVQLELIGLGAVALREGKLQISSPLVRSILLSSVTYERRCPVAFVPVSPESGLLDVPLFVRNIKHFDAKHMREAPHMSNKRNETSRADVKVSNMVPHEDTYTFEILQLLVSSLPSTFKVTGQMNGPNRSKVDFVVSNNKEERVIVEVVAHERDDPVSRKGSVLEHIERCASAYSQITGVVESWVLNFTTRKPDESCEGRGYVWSAATAGVRVVHVWHDLAWTTAKITERDFDDDANPTYMTTDIAL